MTGPGRARPAQQPPPADLAGFPTLVRPRRRLWRAGRTVHANPWWFDGTGGGRFDPLGTGHGACYLGTDRLSGLLEVLGPEMAGGAVHSDDLATPSLFPLDPHHLPDAVADLAHRRAIGYGVTNELSTTTPYTLPQRWAAALERAGFSGIGYRTRFDTSPGARGIAIFGPTGPNPFRWPSTDIVPATVLRARLATACAITIIDTPSLASLPAAPPP
ncbi:MAG: RES family NAD+ phosphorylase [Mycobacteriaceae bacterium]